MARYNYYRHGNEIICVSRFAGKPVRGVAKCDPRDEFDEERGKEIANLRVDIKVAQKRFKMYSEKHKALEEALNRLQDEYEEVGDKMYEAEDLMYSLTYDLNTVLNNPS